MEEKEINEGTLSIEKQQTDFDAGIATILRFCKPWFGLGKNVVADSWFASTKTTVELYNFQ